MGCFLFLSHVCHMVYIFICATLIQKYFCDLWPGHDASLHIQNSCVFCTPQFQFSPPHLLTCNSLKNSLRLTNPYQAKSWRAKRRDDFKYKWWWKGELLVSLPSLIPKFTPSVNSDVESAWPWTVNRDLNFLLSGLSLRKCAFLKEVSCLTMWRKN